MPTLEKAKTADDFSDFQKFFFVGGLLSSIGSGALRPATSLPGPGPKCVLCSSGFRGDQGTPVRRLRVRRV